MSWHLPHRLTPMHHAVSIALLYSISSVALPAVAQAATIGKTTITSAQHEPLAATITVTDIDAADFSAGLANASVYQQMGLTPTASMSVRFEPTSETSGQVIISTTKPISMPFADVVLALEDKGKRNVVPKTLLMPLNTSAAAPIKPTNQITASQKPDLPVVSAAETTPLVAKREAPPALGNSKVTTDATSAPTVATSGAATSSISPKINAANTGTTKPATNSENLSTKAPSTSAADKQLDILSVEVTRKIKAHNEKADEAQDKPAIVVKENPADKQTTEPLTADDKTKPAVEIDSKSKDAQTEADLQAADVTEKPVSKPQKSESSKKQPTASEASTSSYTVQSNDNLWIISQHIAEKNNLDIQTVMSEIQQQNPDAFVNQDASQLKANVQLNLPNYDVVPSQKNIQTAIMAQRQQLDNKPTKDKPKTVASKAEKAKSAQTARTKTTQNIPQGRFSVVAPGKGGTADGTQNKGSAATGNGLNNDVFNTLKASRQRNATQAKRLNATNSALSDYTQKLQLQNQKLADLEARLKKLRNQ